MNAVQHALTCPISARWNLARALAAAVVDKVALPYAIGDVR